MKLKGKPKWILTLIIVFHITFKVEASRDDDDEVRILVVGVRGQSRFIAADLLSGRRDGGQEDGEIVKTPVITDEAGRTMLVTGPNLCEEDAERQTFTTALFHSSPGPHAVLMVLNLEDQQSGQCDVKKRAQEMLGAEVLQYCIVLLIQNHQEPFTGASRGIAGEIINACGGRFHIIRDSEPKPAQGAALIAEIEKLVWLNGGKFYTALNQAQLLEAERLTLLQRLKEIDGKFGESQFSSAMHDTLGLVGWSLLVSLVAVVLATEEKSTMLIFEVTLAGLVTFMASLRSALSPHVAFALNLALCSTVAAAFMKHLPIRKSNIGGNIGREFLFPVGLGVTLGSIASVRTLSDVFVALCAAFGVANGAFAFLYLSFELTELNNREIVLLFLFYAVGAELALLCAIVLNALFGVTLTIILIVIAIAVAPNYLNPHIQNLIIDQFLPIVFFSCVCVCVGSVVLTIETLLGFLKVCIEYLLGSYLFYPALLIGSLMLIGSSVTF
ncbi:uncharacterized protein LOC122331152 isoform X3 [Puntigrus tetrazona]|uniref:uncharacterized protein LOC122331152 isoform X3 n=1 Tax=Puntigrus tetrazona TaxID=1606681 RepID=UPI001C899D1E|nr:uncharacterized protein LOC122331152 isoform X3 [Puntigrus tetrazona]XP_043084579.1 uncharacterized protein LOC122331152 isoform X3 [Puntigrus tetrazona]